MNPLYRDILGGLIRTLVVWLGGKAGVLLTEEEVPAELISGGIAVAVAAWSILQKVRARRKLVTALSLDKKLSESHLDDIVATESTPSILTPVDVVPKVVV